MQDVTWDSGALSGDVHSCREESERGETRWRWGSRNNSEVNTFSHPSHGLSRSLGLQKCEARAVG
jgi:hypothetical protein